MSRGRALAAGLIAFMMVFALGPVLAGAQELARPKPPAAKPLGKPGKATAAKPGEPQDGIPFRGAILIDTQGGQFRDPLRLAQFLEELRRTPFSDVVIQVRAYGDAYYDSALVPKAYGVAEMLSETERFDPLAMFLSELKKDPRDAKRRVIAWIEPFRVANANRAVPEAETHVSKTHPDWLSRDAQFKAQDAEGNAYLDPGLVPVQEHLEQVVAELMGRYALDGILIDGMRYPGFASDWGYHPKALEAWRAKSGNADAPAPDDESWRAMRRGFIDQGLARMFRAAKAVKPQAVVAVAALAEGDAPANAEEFKGSLPYQGALQDWAGWMKDKKADQIHLMNFRNEGEGAAAFDGWNAFAAKLIEETKTEVIVAVSGHQNISLDVLSQMRRVYDSGFLGVDLASFREPIQDLASRELFFRALANKILAADSLRAPTPDVLPTAFIAVPSEPAPSPTETASAPPIEPPAPPAESPAPTEPMESKGEPAPGPGRDQALAEKLKERPLVPTEQELIRPSDDAMDFLRRMYANIFNGS